MRSGDKAAARSRAEEGDCCRTTLKRDLTYGKCSVLQFASGFLRSLASPCDAVRRGTTRCPLVRRSATNWCRALRRTPLTRKESPLGPAARRPVDRSALRRTMNRDASRTHAARGASAGPSSGEPCSEPRHSRPRWLLADIPRMRTRMSSWHQCTWPIEGVCLDVGQVRRCPARGDAVVRLGRRACSRRCGSNPARYRTQDHSAD